MVSESLDQRGGSVPQSSRDIVYAYDCNHIPSEHESQAPHVKNIQQEKSG